MSEREEQGVTFWWERRAFLLVLIVLAGIPLVYPPIPPLVDLLGHMGRYRVELGLTGSPWLQHYYGFRWAMIGNLGVDMLIKVLGPVMVFEPAVKLIVLAIPSLTVAGMLWVAREVHGRVPPAALFALPFAYGLPFLYGFVNYTLAMALALLAFALWLRLGRLGRTRLRAFLFVPISVIVFFCHTYGWGALGLFSFSAEAVRQHDKGVSWKGWAESGTPRLGDGASAGDHAGLAQRDPWWFDSRLVRLGEQMGMALFSASRSLATDRSGIGLGRGHRRRFREH